jgi:orotate phosphoribosyltransferase-like protein
MINKYNMCEYIEGEFYKVEDVEWLFQEKFQINKLNLQDGDIIVIKVSGIKSDERVKRIHDFMCDTFKNRFNKKVEVVTVIEDIELGILKGTYKSNFTHLED